LSRTEAREDNFEGMILMLYFRSNFITAAITAEEQSASGTKPILSSFISGASDPAAQAALRTAAGTRFKMAAAPTVARSRLWNRHLPAPGIRALERMLVSIRKRIKFVQSRRCEFPPEYTSLR
jgi:hypothetical protein